MKRVRCKLKIFNIIIAIFLLQVVSADLLINPLSINTQVFENVETNQQTIFTNTHNFSIFNFEFTQNPYITYPTINEIKPNESAIVSFKIKTNNTFNQNFNIVTKFLYLIDVNLPSKTYNVTITNSQFDPINLTIEQGDFIRWLNADTLPHTITSSTFDHLLQPNETRTLQFNQVENISYKDNNIGYFGFINVKNRTLQFANNPEFNKVISINIDSRRQSSEMQLELLKSNFTIEHDKIDEGVLKAKNIGNNKLFNIQLIADKWVSFDENRFSLEPNTENFVVFHIDPIILNTSETNKTYIIRIKANSENSGEVSSEISIFVPFKELLFDLSNLTNEELQKRVIELSQILSKFLNTSNQQSQPQIIYKESTIGVNFTESDILKDRQRISSIEEVMKEGFKFQNDKTETIDTKVGNVDQKLSEVRDIANKSLDLSQKNLEEIENSKKLRFVGRIFLIVLATVSISIYYMKTYYFKKREAIQ